MTLYTRWLSIADRFSENQALLDWKSGHSWTFAEIQVELDRRDSLSRGGLVFPNGWQAELIFDTLRAWRDGAILCPVEGESPDPERFLGIPANIAHVKITSGSTAEPKMILFTEEQLAMDAENIVATMGLRPDCPNLGVISMAHSYGFSNLFTPLLLHGVPLVWVGDPMPSLMSTILGPDEAAYTLPAVPAMWRAWLEAGVINGDSVKLAISAGAPLSLEIESRLYEEGGVKVHNFYGSSECGAIAYDRTREPRTEAACVGTAMENVGLEVRGSEGVLVVNSEAVGSDYWPVSGNESAMGGGEFTTSDLAEIDEVNGKVFLRARYGETINVAGRKVAPGKIEEAILATDPRIQCCVVFGVPSEDTERVEDIVACIATIDDDWDELEVKSKAQRSLAGYEMPRHWWQCKDMKADARGKLSRRKWRELYLDTQY